MGKQKLREEQVLMIHTKLQKGYTHQEIADMYGVSREAITKIKKSLTHPNHPESRWNDVARQSELLNEIVDNMTIPKQLYDYLEKTTSNAEVGKFMRTIHLLYKIKYRRK